MSDMPASPLGRLIERVVHDNFDGVQQRLATQMGISPQSVSRYKTEYPLKTIVPSVLVAFARAAGIGIDEVVRAALASAKLPDVYDPPQSLREAVRADALLSYDQKRMIIAMLTEAARDQADVPTRALRLAARKTKNEDDEPVS